ncbi:hypothetical protein [Mycobacterium asiaticum]|nr:hypothetical protein [Mycobacterium asiaticum]
MFGRSEEEWDSLVDNAIAILREQAAQRKLNSYSELNAALVRRTGQPAFDFSVERDRTAMGRLLGEVVQRTHHETGGMLSALVAYIDSNDAGPGFYKLATHLGLLPPSATADEKLAFWSRQVKRMHEYHASPPQQRR